MCQQNRQIIVVTYINFAVKDVCVVVLEKLLCCVVLENS